jgi:hypothetical protein
VKKLRVTIRHNPDDSADDLRVAARVRRDLWAHSPVEVDPDSPSHGTHRDADRNAYFEFATNCPDEVQRVIDAFGYATRASVSIVTEGSGPECANCGNVAGPVLPTVCPTCKFRDISACPHCRQEIPRQSYLPVSGDLFKCPECHRRVRLRMIDPLFDSKGHYNQPLVVVDLAEG